jgi:hypothetical protein
VLILLQRGKGGATDGALQLNPRPLHQAMLVEDMVTGCDLQNIVKTLDTCAIHSTHVTTSIRVTTRPVLKQYSIARTTTAVTLTM